MMFELVALVEVQELPLVVVLPFELLPVVQSVVLALVLLVVKLVEFVIVQSFTDVLQYFLVVVLDL